MKAKLFIIGGLIFAAAVLNAQPQVGIDKIIPTAAQLGAGWLSNTIAVLVDPLSSPSEVTQLERNWLQHGRRIAKSDGREAFAVIRYHYKSRSPWSLVFIHRYKSKEQIPQDWGTDKETKVKLDSLPKVGEEVRFCQRNGLFNDICFRRGNYCMVVEGAPTVVPIEKLEELAKALDDDLVKAQKALASPARRSNNAILIAPEKTNLSGRDAQNKGTGINVNSTPQGL